MSEGKELLDRIVRFGDRISDDFYKIGREARDRYDEIMCEFYSLRAEASLLINGAKIKPNDAILVDGETFLITNVERNGDVVTVTAEREEQGV